MTLIVPIVIAALACGAFAKQMTPRLWSLVVLIVIVSIGWFSLHH